MLVVYCKSLYCPQSSLSACQTQCALAAFAMSDDYSTNASRVRCLESWGDCTCLQSCICFAQNANKAFFSSHETSSKQACATCADIRTSAVSFVLASINSCMASLAAVTCRTRYVTISHSFSLTPSDSDINLTKQSTLSILISVAIRLWAECSMDDRNQNQPWLITNVSHAL